MKIKSHWIKKIKFVDKIKAIRLNLRTINLFQKLRLERFTKSAIVISTIAIFLVVNFVLSLVSLRLDLSKDKVYTLSESTKNIIKNLKDQATITLYRSDNVPPRATPVEREIVDLLREFDRSSSNISFEIVTFNPQEDVETAKKAYSLGVYPLSVSQQEAGEVSLSEIYFGVVLAYKDKTEPILQSFNYSDLEYSLTAGIYRLSTESLPEVGLIGFGSEVATSRDPFSNFRGAASRFYNVIDITDKIPETVKALVLYDDHAKDFTNEELDLLGNYFSKGRTIVFTDGVTVGDQALETASGEAKLHALLEKRGIKVENNLVLSSQAEMVNLGNSGFSVFIPYPLWIKTDNFDNSSEFFNSITNMTFPWVSTVRALNKEGFNAKELVFSTSQSWEQKDNFAIFPQAITKPEAGDFKEFSVVAESRSKNAKLTVIGSSRFISNQYLSPESSNIGFVTNILSDYASGGVLSGIARRQNQVYSLPILPKSIEEVYKYLNILLLPLMFGLYGTVRIVKRSRET